MLWFLGGLWKDWCWSWNSNTLATSREELTHWKRFWCWEGLGTGGEGDDRGWDGWMASPNRWTWVWVSSGSWWQTGKPGNPWGHKESDTTERLSLTTLIGPHLEVKLLSHVWLSDSMDCNPPGSSVRQEDWSRLPFPSPGDLPDQGIEPGSPILQAVA